MSDKVTAVDDVLSEYHGLEAQLADPDLYNDAARARKVGKRFNELQPIIQAHARLTQVREDMEAAREMAAEDAEFAARSTLQVVGGDRCRCRVWYRRPEGGGLSEGVVDYVVLRSDG